MNRVDNPITTVHNRQLARPIARANGWTPGDTEEPACGQSASTDTLFAMVWRRRWIIACSVLLALAGMIAYLNVVVPRYTSTSRIYVERQGPKIMEEIAQGVMTQSNNYLYTQAELLQSTDVLAAVVENWEGERPALFAGDKSAVAVLRDLLEVSVGEKDDIINISLSAPDAAEASQAVNAIVDAYVSYQARRKRSTSAEILNILQDERGKRVAELSEKLERMMAFKKAHPLLSFQTDKSSAIHVALMQLVAAETSAELETIQSKARYETLKKVVAEPETLAQYLMIQDEPGVNEAAVVELRELMARMNQLRGMRFEDRLRGRTMQHPTTLPLNAEFEEAQKRIEELHRGLADAQMSLARQRYLIALDAHEHIKKELEAQRQEAVLFTSQEASYTVLRSEWEQAKRLCDLLYDRISELDVTDEAGALNISILEHAEPAGQPSSPDTARAVAITVALGLVFGCGLALLRDLTDSRLKSSSHAAGALSAPALGAIPSVPKRFRIENAGLKLLQAADSPAAEAYRALRTAVLCGLPQANAKTLLVTSPQMHEGKTTFTSNLAASLASVGQSVIVLDADFRKPTQHRIFGVPNDEGLSDVILGKQILELAIQRSSRSNLDVLTAGTSLTHSAEAFSSQAFVDVLETLSRSSYDLVLIDAPPVLPVADAHVLASIADATILILRAGKTLQKDIQQTRSLLAGVGANILGAVINDVPRGKTQFGSYYRGYETSRVSQSTRVTVRHADSRPAVTRIRALRSTEASQRESLDSNVDVL